MVVSSRDKKLILMITAGAVFAISYFAVFRPTLEKNTTLKNENATLSQRVNELKALVEQQEFYTSETKRIQLEVEQLLVDYPSYLMIENEIMNVVDSEKFSDAEVSSLTVSDAVLVEVAASGSGEDSEEMSSSAAASAYSLYDMSTSISYTASYTGMKELLNSLSGDSEKHSVSSFSATLDTATGEITGVVGYEAYYIFGQDKNYNAPDIPSMDHGTDNIFGSIDFDDTSEGADETAAAEE